MKLRRLAVSFALFAAVAARAAPAAEAGPTALRASDPSVLRVGSTYIGV